MAHVRINSTNSLSSTHKSETRKNPISQWHSYKSNKSLTHCHTGLSGTRCALTQQTALVQLTPKQWTVSRITQNNSHWCNEPISLEQKPLNNTYPISHQHNGKRLHQVHQSWLLAFNRSNTRSDPQVQYAPLRPTFYFFDNSLTPKYPISRRHSYKSNKSLTHCYTYLARWHARSKF